MMDLIIKYCGLIIMLCLTIGGYWSSYKWGRIVFINWKKCKLNDLIIFIFLFVVTFAYTIGMSVFIIKVVS